MQDERELINARRRHLMTAVVWLLFAGTLGLAGLASRHPNLPPQLDLQMSPDHGRQIEEVLRQHHRKTRTQPD